MCTRGGSGAAGQPPGQRAPLACGRAMRPNAHAESKHRRKPPLDIVDDRVVMTRMTPWSPAQGPVSDAPLSASGDDGVFSIDTSVEGPWVPRHLSGDRAPIVQIVDGVRRVEAYAVSDTTSGAAAPALFGSYAVGVVRCEPNRATVLTDPSLLRVERRYLQAGSHAEDLLVRAGQTELRFRATPVPHALKPSELVRELTSRMLAAEARLTKRLSADCGALTLVDGPLRARTTGRRVAGYIKRTANWYLGAEERAIFDDLDVGDRTPLFRLSVEGQTKRERFSWYVRIADLGPHLHPLASSHAARDVGDPAGGAGHQARGRMRAHPAVVGRVAGTRPTCPAEPHAGQRTRGQAPPPSRQP